MTGEEKILQALGEINSHLTKHDAMFDAINTRLDGIDNRLDKVEQRLDKVEQRLDGVESRLDRLEKDVTWMRLEIENDIKPNIQKLADGHALLWETMATKEQVESLREDLATEKFTLELLATKRVH